MLHIRSSPAAVTNLTDQRVMSVFSNDPAVSSLAVLREASAQPPGDIVLADVAREAANEWSNGSALGMPSRAPSMWTR